MLVLSPVNLVLTTLDCLIWVGGGTVKVSPLALARAVIISFLPLFSISLVNPDGAVTELFNGTLKLRYSSTPISLKLPSWPISTPCFPVGVPGPDPSVHFPDHDFVVQRPAKRFRITGKSSAHKREPISGDGLPTPKRWKRG